jgi:hypothetical protein
MRLHQNPNGSARPHHRLESAALARAVKRPDHRASRVRGKRARGQANQRLPFVPPENWYEPADRSQGYRFVMQPAGEGFRHVLTAGDVRQRLAELPAHFVEPLQVVQFSRLTRKKQLFPCYGMQWGATIYLYPIEDDLVEYYHRPPTPAQRSEATMYGGRWQQESSGVWRLVWTERAIQDFYLNNILIHELGHLLDNRNNRSIDRERYAEWFAIEYGYRATQAERSTGRASIRRRHHSKRR